MDTNLIARAAITVDAPSEKVWDALVNPDAIRQYMFGTNVESDFRVGSPIVWKGEWKGKAYEDRGKILRAETGYILQYSHFSPMMGLEDRPENYHTVTIQLSREGEGTRVTLTQDHNDSEEAREHSQKNWEMLLRGLKQYVEK